MNYKEIDLGDQITFAVENKELSELKELVREYLKRPSVDGRSDRQVLRKLLAEKTLDK